ncbi:hypothetical protein Btru_036865 [Bulinus truncatus]|nr:hypothetical protein Btru_036865 [Bulinus truncatus]
MYSQKIVCGHLVLVQLVLKTVIGQAHANEIITSTPQGTTGYQSDAGKLTVDWNITELVNVVIADEMVTEVSPPRIYDLAEIEPVPEYSDESIIDETEDVPVPKSWTGSGFYWNKTALSPTAYHNSWCPRRCLHGNLVLISDIERLCISTRCFPCECKRPACEIYGICCPDVTSPFHPPLYNRVHLGLFSQGDVDSNKVLNSTPDIFEFFNKNFKQDTELEIDGSNTRPKIACDVKSADKKFMYIQSCPSGDFEYERTMCETNMNADNITIEWFTRVIDTATSVAYKNIYCARCNHAIKPLQMEVNIQCETFMSVFTAVDYSQFLRLVLRESSSCVVKQVIPPNMSLFSCNEKYFGCSINDVNVGNSMPNPLDFMMVITSSDYEATQNADILQSECQVTEWLAPNGTCLQLECSEGKLFSSGNCSTAISQVTGLHYIVQLVVVPNEEIFHKKNLSTIDIVIWIQNMIRDALVDYSEKFWIQIGIVNEIKFQARRLNFFWIDGKLVAKRAISRDEFENVTIERFTKLLDNEIPNSTVQFNTISKIVDSDKYCAEIKSTFSYLDCQIHLVIYRWLEQTSSKFTFLENLIQISHVLTCAFMRFDQSSYSLHNDQTKCPHAITISLDFQGLKVSFTSTDELNMLSIDGRGRLIVCRELLVTRFNSVGYKHFVTSYIDVTNFQYILSSFCIGITLLCLTLTIVTYARFKSLRTYAGQNNLCLSVSLLFAHIMNLVRYHMSGRGLLCTAVGLTSHFLWLWVFTWTFICSFRMFKVFTAKTRTTSNKETSSVWQRVGLSLAVPCVFVISVVISSYIRSNTLGYGQYRCFLDTSLLVGVTLIGPAVFISVSNTVFFVLVVYQVYRVGQLVNKDTSKSKDHHHLLVYIKLSSLTGASWVIATIADFTRQEFLTYIHLVLNGLQGLFIFLSFTANKKVLHLYLNWLGQPHKTVTSTSRRTVTEKSSESVRTITTVSSSQPD